MSLFNSLRVRPIRPPGRKQWAKSALRSESNISDIQISDFTLRFEMPQSGLLLHDRHLIDTTDDRTAKSELQNDPITPCTIGCIVHPGS